MDQLKSLIHDRQAVFARGDAASFRRLRNRVNRAYVSPAKYYKSERLCSS